MRQLRTDLAMESAGIHGANELPGVSISGWESGGIQITEVHIHNSEGAGLLGKPEGRYLTLECEGVRRRDADARTAVASCWAKNWRACCRMIRTRRRWW